MITYLNSQNDRIGIITSALCMVHCAVTPFLMMSQVYLTKVGFNYGIWGMMNFLFLIVSFIAMILTIKRSSVRWLRICFAITWVSLTVLVLNEYFERFHLPFDLTYFPAIGLVILHVINIKHCRCETDRCTTATT